ncbi:MAG: recombinase family protein, partial [Chloroflexota bacterium]|nr:recombinase family protein [Chloroflexota bacterium]
MSTRMQGRFGFSLNAQHQTLDEFTAANGWVLPPHLRFRDGEDEDASGADWDLPDLNRMMEAARRREFQVLAVPDLDRFARSLVKGLVLEEQLRKYGVRVVYQRVPVEDTPEGRLLKHQLFSFAEFEHEKTTLRTTMGRREKARLGQVVGVGAPPYGYRFTFAERSNQRRVACGLEPDPTTAPIAGRILRLLRTRSTIEIADELNREGVTGPTGRLWGHKAIHRIATNPVYVGIWVYGRHGRRASPEDHDGVGVPVTPLVERHEWDEVQRALEHHRCARRGRVPRELDAYLLRGILTCGHCQGALHTFTNQGTRYYACSRHRPSAARRYGKPVCDLPDAHATDLEAELWRILGETLLDEDHLAAGLKAARAEHERGDRLRRERLAALDAEVGRQRHRLDGLASRLADAGDGEFFAALLRQAKEIETLIGRLDRERADLGGAGGGGLSEAGALEIERFAAEAQTGLSLEPVMNFATGSVRSTPIHRRSWRRISVRSPS